MEAGNYMIDDEVRAVVDDVHIRQMRGGTIVTHAALKALRSAALKSTARSSQEFMRELEENGKYLASLRTTSVSLSNGLRQVLTEVQQSAANNADVQRLIQTVVDATQGFERRLDESVKMIAEIGARRIKEGDVILTHSYSSSVIAILKRAHDQGRRFRVFVTETRPELEGRDVARELAAHGIETTLIIDSAVSHFVKDSDKVLVGAEAVAANGAIVNKIGTATIAAVAHEARIRVFVAASTYKFSPETMFGELIEIEERDPSFVLDNPEMRKLPRLAVRNPAFDITSSENIDLIITERGVIPPQAAIMIVRETKGSLSSSL
jgi:ribose 1,5-bisphosphate isomerase